MSEIKEKIDIHIICDGNWTVLIKNSTLDQFEDIKRSLKNPFVRFIELADTFIVKSRVLKIHYERCGDKK